jgi:predicted O-linked N-acetylglucosamine transferase (SPINDLY family)
VRSNDAIAAQIGAKLQQGVAWHQGGHLLQARGAYQEILKMAPGHFDALHLLGVTAYQMQNALEAVNLIGRAIEINPGNAGARFNMGAALQELGQLDPALASYDAAISLDANLAEAYSNRGIILKDLNRLEAALDSCSRAIAIRPGFAEAHFNRGVVLHRLGRWPMALDSYERAIALRPHYAEALLMRGNLLSDLNRWDAALASYEQAIAARHSYASAYFNRANVYRELRRLDAALGSYEQAIAIEPNNAENHCGRGETLREMGRFSASIESLDRAALIDPGLIGVHGMRMHTRMRIMEWGDFDGRMADVGARIESGEAASNPFYALSMWDAPSMQRRAAENWVRAKAASELGVSAFAKYAGRDKIRIGYFSADFCNHPVATLAARLFETHDRSRFQVTAFSIGPDTRDAMRIRCEKAFDSFVDVRGKSDQDIVQLARGQEIDIAVDLGGFTGDGRLARLFALRPAPLQVSYLGFTGTTGADHMDYLVADDMTIPEQQRPFYKERIIFLPDSYLVNDTTRAIAETPFEREDLGLPSSAFVYCCFNNWYKINPETFGSWMRILKRVDGSVLWLADYGGEGADNLRREAVKSGIDPERVIFAKRMPSSADHLARHRMADLFIDTLPFNAHSTAADALWAGLPMVTLVGESFAGRVAASLLRAIRLPELITRTRGEYEELAVSLAGDPRRLADIRTKLAANRLTAPLFDVGLYRKHIESSFDIIMDRYRRNLEPADIRIPPDGIGQAPRVS